MFKKISKKISERIKASSIKQRVADYDASEVIGFDGTSKYRERTHLEKKNNFFFIHIPKTAGTSFRKALESEHRVIGDYGKHSSQTHSLILDHIYREQAPLNLKKSFNEVENTWLVGHVTLAKYSDIVSARHIISFVREPIQQVVSHYNHYVAFHGFKGTLAQFLKRPLASNFQRKNLAPLPLGLIGYVGLTDCYEESIQLINSYYGLSLKVIETNVNKKKTIEKEAISPELRAKITKLNPIDINCVKEAEFLHVHRVALTQQNKEWVYSHFTINPNNILTGCAYYSHSEKAVEFNVLCNGELLEVMTADNFFGNFPKVNFPRERYIGVHFSLTNRCKEGDKIEVFAKETGQQLTYKSLTLKK
ncbi:sulfotransferase family 2 domain-containing protein [uncultured Psychromonas sp.]|uniref:sulfotransferase family 2 domain-containing protein n=1 Tax=uncultured Psychromonas sp. TaxID=173974 RepID=UPI002619209F|nr:sulfotransferase family 2 domain-containing protein [uncultured Psychromonas sp.]